MLAINHGNKFHLNHIASILIMTDIAKQQGVYKECYLMRQR